MYNGCVITAAFIANSFCNIKDTLRGITQNHP